MKNRDEVEKLAKEWVASLPPLGGLSKKADEEDSKGGPGWVWPAMGATLGAAALPQVGLASALMAMGRHTPANLVNNPGWRARLGVGMAQSPLKFLIRGKTPGNVLEEYHRLTTGGKKAIMTQVEAMRRLAERSPQFAKELQQAGVDLTKTDSGSFRAFAHGLREKSRAHQNLIGAKAKATGLAGALKSPGGMLAAGAIAGIALPHLLGLMRKKREDYYPPAMQIGMMPGGYYRR